MKKWLNAASFLGGESSLIETQNCLGCLLATGEVTPPGGTIWQNHFWHLAYDANNFIPGFLILGTIPHVIHSFQIPAQDFIWGFRLIHQVRIIMADQFSLKDYLLFQSDHSTGHHHIWMLPLYSEMQSFGRSSEGILPFLQWSKIHWNTPEKMEQINQIAEITRQNLKTWNI